MPGKAFVAGVGMVAFGKPGASDTYDVMAVAAVRKALDNAGLSYDAIQQAIVGYVYGDSTSGQRALYEVGMTGIPIANVNNNCSTGSTALFLARQLVESGAVDCVLALGFEQMQPGALSGQWTDRPSPFSRFNELCDEIAPYDAGQGQPPRGAQSAGAVPQGGERGRGHGGADGLSRSRHDAADGLSADLRRGGGDSRVTALR